MILDFSRLLPGPLATSLLQQMGARVVRVEHPRRSDMARMQPPFIDGRSTLFASLNTGKETVSLDYNTPAGKAEVCELVREADVLVEQFRPGVMASWELGYEQLRSINTGLIYASLTGYGQKGELALQAGHDINYLALAGILDLNRDGNGRPVIPGVQVADIGGGSYMLAMAVVSALLQRERTGRGSYLDVAMLDGLLPMMTIPFSQHQGGFDVRSANFLNGGLVNYQVYETADKRWMALGALEPKFWNAFCQLAERPDWQRSSPMECSVHVFPKEELEAFFKSRTQAEWVDWADGHDICLTPVRSTGEVLSDDAFLRKQSLQTVKLTDTNSLVVPGVPYSIT
jgi:crotonobetainyl-CoA:carnitine CoA-transferase CaiB-like acyl-CoA transferase